MALGEDEELVNMERQQQHETADAETTPPEPSGMPPPPVPLRSLSPTRSLLSVGHRRLKSRQDAEEFQFNVLATELDDLSGDQEIDENEQGVASVAAEDITNTTNDPSQSRITPSRKAKPKVLRHLQRQKSVPHKSFWRRMVSARKKKRKGEDPFHDMSEGNIIKVSETSSTDSNETPIKVPSLRECQRYLKNEEKELHRERAVQPRHQIANIAMNISAALYIWTIYMLSGESVLVLGNSAAATAVFCQVIQDHDVKLDFTFLAFAVVFPLTFLMQSTFTRREQALSWLADFKSALLSTALMTLTADWPSNSSAATADGNSLVGGRLSLPEDFNANVVRDCRELVVLSYQYLSMPNVSHARNVVFWNKQAATKRVHALQNDIVKHINDIMYDFAMQTEELRRHGFQSGEASRLHQYHQYIQQRFDHLRAYKYYRTPQATRSFGRAYILILPWLSGPYFAWVKQSTSLAFAIVLSCMTFLIVQGLLNAQKALEDPFVPDVNSQIPGIDEVKLDFEMAIVLQAIEQYYASAELQRKWELKRRDNGGKTS